MFVDSDDCISKNIAEFVSQNQDCNGWFLSTGYQYREGSRFIRYIKKGFGRSCGTCNIIRTDLISSYIKTTQPEDIKDRAFLHHVDLPRIMASRGHSLQSLPFPGAVYITDNSENFVGQTSIVLKNLSVSLRGSVKYRLILLMRAIASRPLRYTFRTFTFSWRNLHHRQFRKPRKSDFDGFAND
ncbi:MAG: hypothetical protein HC780_05215 [Leptolyngbyaceae cyanobacterium CSU_1_3]|nr:hypothetical protein [Leptolyngbyaceae cyanobacterium CSU_1_3]